MLRPDTGLVFTEAHIKRPVEAILNGPVRADGVSEAVALPLGQTREVVASLGLRVVVGGPLGFDHAEAGEAGPVGLILEPGDVTGEPRATNFEPPMVFVNGLNARVRCGPAIKEGADFLEGGLMVALEGQDILIREQNRLTTPP